MSIESKNWYTSPGDTEQDIKLLDLLLDAGIEVDCYDIGLTDRFINLAKVGKFRASYETPDQQDALIVWFMTGDDQMALEKVTYDGPFEYGCSWLRVRPPITLRALINHLRGRVTGYYATAIPRRDIPELVSLLERRAGVAR